MNRRKLNKPRNIYNHIISEINFRADFWANQILSWRFWKKDYTSSFVFTGNIMRTDVRKIEKLADDSLDNYIWEPCGQEVMKVIERNALN